MNATVIKRTIQDKLLYQGVVMVDVNIAYPQMTSGRAETGRREFNRYYIRQARRQMRHARQDLLPMAIRQYEEAQQEGYPFNAYTLMQTFEVTYNAGYLLSLYLDVYEYTGGAHGNTGRCGNTWDLKRRRMLRMSELFRPGYDYRDTILRAVEREATRREESGEVDYFEDLYENLHEYFDEANYYLTYNGLAVFYPQYSIGPYAIGIQVFTVPYEAFGKNLAYPLLSLI